MKVYMYDFFHNINFCPNKNMKKSYLFDETMKFIRSFRGRSEGERSLGKPGRRWKDNIKMDLKEWVGMFRNRMDFAPDRDNGVLM